MSNDKERDVAHRGWLAGGGEMGALIRAKDWSKTPLGPLESWSPALRNTVGLMMANRFPLLLWWGPQYVSIYNDPYRPVLGAKHPWALGQPVSECWKEIWPILQPLIDTPFHGGPATWNDDIVLELNRHGFVEETHFTIAYSPVPDGTVPSGIGGVLATVHEITEKVVGERRVVALRDLGAQAVEVKTAEEVCRNVAKTLAAHDKDVPFVLLYLIDGDGRRARFAGGTGIALGSPGCPPVIDLGEDKEQRWPIDDVVRTETMQVVGNLDDRFNAAVPPGPWADPPREAVAVPIRANSARQLAGVLVAGVSARLKLDELYCSFYELMAGRIATGIAGARAYEEERQRAEALAELDRVKTVFFSNVSHEFRTPLTLMLGPLEQLKAEFGRSMSSLDASQYQQVDLAHRNGLRLLKLVNTLLDFSRIEAGRAQALYEETDLAALTADLASVFRSAIEKAGFSLIVDCPPLPEHVFVDRDMWEKVVLNLLSNAFKFTFEGEIEVALRPSGKHVELSIRDTGIGIPEDQLGKIFERFHRVAGMQGRTYEGTGIGLSLVQELSRLHGGSVSVESLYGKGSTFTVTIPFGTAHLPADRIGTSRRQASTATGVIPFVEEALRWLPDEDSAECSVLNPELSGSNSALTTQDSALPSRSGLSTQDSALRRQHSRPRVLLADDNADMREYVSRLLRGRFEVQAVADGQAALEAAQADQPDLVLADVMMPRLDGFELLRALRTDATTKTIPFILLSARAGEQAHVEGLEHGADDYLIKPFSARELLARVQAHLDMARVRREAGEELRRSEERFARFMQHLPGLAWVKDEQGRYVYANDAAQKAFHAPQEGLCGKTDEEVFPPEVAAQFRENDRRMLAGGTGVQVVETLEHQDGLLHHSLVSKFPIPGPDGQTTLIGGMAIDITERKQAEEALRRLNDELEQRVAERTQDLVQSQDRLRALASEVNLAEQRERKRLATELHDYLQQMLVLGKLKLGQGKRLAEATPLCAKLINETDEVLSDALQYTRTLVAELSPLALRDHGLAAGLKWLGDDMKKHDMAVTVTVAEGAEIDVPEDRSVLLFQSVRELLINASKHAGTHEAWVKLEQRDGQLVIEVKDNGVGFDLAAADTPNRDLSSKFGLFSIRERMRALGGSFDIQSSSGQGATATLSLPLRGTGLGVRGEEPKDQEEVRGKVLGVSSSEYASHLTPHPSRVRVLLVDDHAMVRQGLRTVLDSYADIEVVGEASDGEEAVAAMEALHPAVVLMDINMPTMNGIEATAQIKARHPEVIVIGLSVNARGENERAMKQAGAAMLLTKEAAMDELYRVMQEALKTNV